MNSTGLVVDSHIHLWDGPADPPSHWGGGRAIRKKQLLELMAAASVDGAVLIPPGAISGWSNDACFGLAEAMPERFCTFGVLPPDERQAREALSGWEGRAAIRGLRCSFESEPGRTWAKKGLSSWIWGACVDRGLRIMVNAPHHLELIGRIASTYSELRIAIDHVGLAQSEATEPLEPRLRPLIALADLENVVVKASALPLQAIGGFPFERVHHAVRLLVKTFGASRVFWGSDLSRLECSYRETVELFRLPGFMRPADADAVLGGAVSEWLEWAPDSGARTTGRHPR